MDAFQIFRLIFGIIIAVFILFLLLRLTGVYAGFQTDVQALTITENFVTTAENVFVSGNPAAFTDFGRMSDAVFFVGTEEPPELQLLAGSVPVTMPLLFRHDRSVLVSRGVYDVGWWEFRYVLALPETVLVFNLRDAGEIDKDIVREIVGVFPSTSIFIPNITFTFCDGNRLDPRYDRFDLIESSAVLRNLATPQQPCIASLSGSRYRLVTIAADCARRTEDDVCITAPMAEGAVGSVFVVGEEYFYTDPLDLVFLIISAGETDRFGRPLAPSYYQYKQRVVSDALSLAAAIEQAKRALIQDDLDAVLAAAEDRQAIAQGSCEPLYADFVDQIREASRAQEAGVTALTETHLAAARQQYDEIAAAGCLRLTADADQRASCLFTGFLDFRPALEELRQRLPADSTNAADLHAMDAALNETRGVYDRLVSQGCEE